MIPRHSIVSECPSFAQLGDYARVFTEQEAGRLELRALSQAHVLMRRECVAATDLATPLTDMKASPTLLVHPGHALLENVRAIRHDCATTVGTRTPCLLIVVGASRSRCLKGEAPPHATIHRFIAPACLLT